MTGPDFAEPTSTLEQEAYKAGAEYGMQYEVLAWYRDRVLAGDDHEEALRCACWEWLK